MTKEYLEALEIECGELVEMDLLFLYRNGENQEKWHNSEAFKKAVDFEKKYGKSHIHILKQALQRLEEIDNANPSEAMSCLETINTFVDKYNNYYQKGYYDEDCETIIQVFKKAQEQEKKLDFLEDVMDLPTNCFSTIKNRNDDKVTIMRTERYEEYCAKEDALKELFENHIELVVEKDRCYFKIKNSKGKEKSFTSYTMLDLWKEVSK